MYDDVSPGQRLIFCCFIFNYKCSPVFSQELDEEARIRRLYEVMPYLVRYITICSCMMLVT
jgi:hypothetical protein